MKLLNSINPIKTILCTGFAGMLLATATPASADDNFHTTGRYQVDIFGDSNTLNCRRSATTSSRVVKALPQGTYINVIDVVGTSKPWLKTSDGCYVRGHYNYLRQVEQSGSTDNYSDVESFEDSVELEEAASASQYDSNYYMTGSYKVTLSNGSRSLNCRRHPRMGSTIDLVLYKGEDIYVTDVVGSSQPWLKTSDGCYVRGHANYITHQK